MSVDTAAVTQADLVGRAAQRVGEKPAFIDNRRSVTWSELDREVSRLAGALAADGIGPGDRVVLVLPTQIPFVVAFFAVLRAGAVVVPVNPGLTTRELTHVVRDSRATLLIGGAGSVSDVRLLSERALGDLLVSDRPADAQQVAVAPDDLAALLYTSGTTGAPRGAMLTHRNLLANREQLDAIDPTPLRSDDVLYVAVPGFHIYGLGAGVCQVAYAGATGVLGGEFRADRSLRQMTEHAVTGLIAVPQQYGAWSEYADDQLRPAFAAVRMAMSGAAPLADRLLARFAGIGVTVWEGYGLTETSPVLTSALVGGVVKGGSIGRPIPGVELQLRDTDGSVIAGHNHDDSDDDDDPDEPGAGEIVVRGDNVFVGYWPEGDGGPDEDGWFATGDIAYADADGDLHIIDRAKELILVSGFNVYPSEVEQVLDAMPEVAGSAVVGQPTEATGETVTAYVVRAGTPAGAALTTEAVGQHCALNLARYKRPSVIEFVDELPYTTSGKVRRHALRTAAGGPPRESTATPTHQPPR